MQIVTRTTIEDFKAQIDAALLENVAELFIARVIEMALENNSNKMTEMSLNNIAETLVKRIEDQPKPSEAINQIVTYVRQVLPNTTIKVLGNQTKKELEEMIKIVTDRLEREPAQVEEIAAQVEIIAAPEEEVKETHIQIRTPDEFLFVNYTHLPDEDIERTEDVVLTIGNSVVRAQTFGHRFLLDIDPNKTVLISNITSKSATPEDFQKMINDAGENNAEIVHYFPADRAIVIVDRNSTLADAKGFLNNPTDNLSMALTHFHNARTNAMWAELKAHSNNTQRFIDTSFLTVQEGENRGEQHQKLQA